MSAQVRHPKISIDGVDTSRYNKQKETSGCGIATDNSPKRNGMSGIQKKESENVNNLDKRNKYMFGLGTLGRDMLYAFEANTILYFLSDVLSLPLWVFATVSMGLSILRIFDALNDPITVWSLTTFVLPGVNSSLPSWWAVCSAPSFSC